MALPVANIQQLPIEVLDEIIAYTIPRRFLDLRIKEQFAPPSITQSTRILREGHMRLSGCALPVATISTANTAGFQQLNINPRWLTANDILLVSMLAHQALQTQPMRPVQDSHKIHRIAIVVFDVFAPHTYGSWGRVLSNFPNLRQIDLCSELGPWSTQQIDDMPHLKTAQFKTEYRGVAKGVKGVSCLGTVSLAGGDITQSLHSPLVLCKNGLVWWLSHSANCTYQKLPDVAIKVIWPESLPADIRARHEELHHALSDGDYL